MSALELIEEETGEEIILDPEKIALALKMKMDELIDQVSDETNDRSEKAIIVDTPQVLYSLSKLLILEEMSSD